MFEEKFLNDDDDDDYDDDDDDGFIYNRSCLCL